MMIYIQFYWFLNSFIPSAGKKKYSAVVGPASIATVTMAHFFPQGTRVFPQIDKAGFEQRTYQPSAIRIKGLQ